MPKKRTETERAGEENRAAKPVGVAMTQEDDAEPVNPIMRPRMFDPQPEYPGAEYQIRVYRMDERSKDWIAHGKLTEDEATVGFVGAHWGGGKYKVVRHRMTEAGSWVYAGQTTFILPGPYKPPREAFYDRDEDSDLGSLPEQARGGGGGDRSSTGPGAGETLNFALVGSVIEMLKAQQSAARAPVPSFDWGPVIATAVPILGNLIERMMNREPDRELIAQLQRLETELATLRERPGPAVNAVGDVLDSLERIVRVSSKVRKLAGGDDDTDPEAAMWGLGKRALEVLAGGAGALPQPIRTTGGPPAPVPEGAPVPPVPRPLWERVLLHHGREIVQAAARGVDPALAADWTASMLPSEIQGAVMELVRKPDAAELAMRVLPDLGNFPEWTREFIRYLRGSLLGEDEPGGEDREDGADPEGEDA